MNATPPGRRAQSFTAAGARTSTARALRKAR